MRTHVKVLFAAFAVGLLAMPAGAQDSATTLNGAISGYESAAHESFQGLATDWSSHHVVYSKPQPGSDAEYKVQQDSRYWMQQIQRTKAQSEVSAAPDADETQVETATQPDARKEKAKKKKKKKKSKLKTDWSVVLNSSAGGVATAGLEMFPAKFQFSTSAAGTCADYVVFNTSLPGVSGANTSTTQPNIIAYNNLYSLSGTCTPVPAADFAYFTGTGSALTSPVLSRDGKKLAFVESSVAAHAILRLVKFKPGEGSFNSGTHNWTTVTPAAASAWTDAACAGTNSCVISITLNGNQQDTNSAPFVNYDGDILYVGDNNGVLHKIINVFGQSGATPSEVVTAPWPVTVHAGNALSSPVFDGVSTNIFVGDASGRGSSVSAAGVLSGTNIALGNTITDGPLVDITTQKVFWFGLSSVTPLTDRLEQTTTAMGGAVTITLPNSGTNGRTGHMHSGAFDNLYFTSVATGHLYFCGLDNGFSNRPALFDVGFNGTGVMANAVANGPTTLVTASATQNECSPATEFLNGATDWLFLSVQTSNASAECAAAGCVSGFNITSSFPAADTSGLDVPGAGGTSAIVIDNAGTTASGQSNVYFSDNSSGTCATSGGTGGCAVQAAQGAL